jgi:hypothetical protein
VSTMSYFDMDRDVTLNVQVDDETGAAAVIQAILNLSSTRGHPAAVCERDDGLSQTADGHGHAIPAP